MDHTAPVVTHSVDRVEFDRAWYAPAGFDPDPGSAAPLSEIVRSARAEAGS